MEIARAHRILFGLQAAANDKEDFTSADALQAALDIIEAQHPELSTRAMLDALAEQADAPASPTADVNEMTHEYQVIEDNGGGLHLFVFGHGGIDRGKVIYAGVNFEYNVGSLRTCLDALDAGESPAGWEDGLNGDLGNPQAHYDFWDNADSGWSIVAEGADGTRTLYPGRMGMAATLEFGIA